MDITKWKSVAVKIEDYRLLKGMCKEKFRAPAGMISKLVDDYIKFRAKKDGLSVEAYKKKLNGRLNLKSVKLKNILILLNFRIGLTTKRIYSR